MDVSYLKLLRNLSLVIVVVSRHVSCGCLEGHQPNAGGFHGG